MAESPAVAKPVNTTLPLVLSIVATVLCWGVPLGIPALVLAVQARREKDAGSLASARTRARVAVALSVAAFVGGFLVEAFLLIRHMAAAFH
jgi:predicted MFS family arabinose efflux permease